MFKMYEIGAPKKGHKYSSRHYRRLANKRISALSASYTPSADTQLSVNQTLDICTASTSSRHEEILIHSDHITDLSNNEINTESTICKPTLSEKLASWAVVENISHTAVNKLLNVLKSDFQVLELKTLPSDARTLLKTPKTTNITVLGPGHYHYFGITKTITEVCNKYGIKLSPNSVFHLSINIDGLPLFKSTGDSFWPILCLIKTINGLDKQVMCVALYQGTKKPEANEFLQDFVTETVELTNHGIVINDQIFEFKIVSLICDLPAKSYILGIKGHNGFFSCTKCTLEGDFINNVVCFLETCFTKRTDETFRNKRNPEHHINESIIENIPQFDIINNVPIDYMHCLLLGVVKRMLCHKKFGWIHGRPPFKIRASSVLLINRQLVEFKKFLPHEFARKTRSIVECKRYKATEFRTLLLYTGFIIFKKYIPKKFYNNFLCVCVATSLLVNPESSKNENCIEFAHELYKCFILNSIKLYGPDFISHNVHNLLHIADCVRTYGALDTFSAFPFENFMSQIKRKIRKAALPLQQVIRRTNEINESTFLFSSNNPGGAQFLIEHSAGPLTLNSTGPQYKIMKTNNFRLNVSKFSDRFILLEDNKIIELKNFVTIATQTVILGAEYRINKPFFQIPCDSSIIGINIIEKTDNVLRVYPITAIKKKLMLLPYKNKFVSFPLLHNLY